MWGDLGASFEHAGRTYLLFGDTVAIDPALHAECADAIATTIPPTASRSS